MARIIFPHVPFILFYGIAIFFALRKRVSCPRPALWTMFAFGMMLFGAITRLLFQIGPFYGFGGRLLTEITYAIARHWGVLSPGLLLGSLIAILVAIFGSRGAKSPVTAGPDTNAMNPANPEGSYGNQPAILGAIGLGSICLPAVAGSAIFGRPFQIEAWNDLQDIAGFLAMFLQLAGLSALLVAAFGWREPGWSLAEPFGQHGTAPPHPASAPRSPAAAQVAQVDTGPVVAGEFRLAEGGDFRALDICPRCGKPARDTVKVCHHFFANPSTLEIVWMGLIGQIVKYLICGLESKELVKVRICSTCSSLSLIFKILEVVVRIGSILLVVVLLQEHSTKSRPLFYRDIGEQILVFSPLLIGLALGPVLHWLFVRFKGILFQRKSPTGENIFKVRSREWLNTVRG